MLISAMDTRVCARTHTHTECALMPVKRVSLETLPLDTASSDNESAVRYR